MFGDFHSEILVYHNGEILIYILDYFETWGILIINALCQLIRALCTWVNI